MNKWKKYISVLFLLILCIGFTGCEKEEKYTEDEIKFKDEYESLNNKLKSDNKTKYMEVSVEKDNNIVYIDAKKAIELIENGTGVIYFGFPECPWCRNAAPALIEAAKEAGLDRVYYFNALSIRDKKHLDENGNIVTDQEGTSEYYKIVDLLKDKLNSYDGLNDETIKRLYFPTVVFIKDGQLIGLHSGTVESQKDPQIALTESQKSELQNIYSDYIHKVLGDLCDEKC